MKKICAKKFIPGLFTSCSRKTRKLRR
jgi:hypothetical protein